MVTFLTEYSVRQHHFKICIYKFVLKLRLRTDICKNVHLSGFDGTNTHTRHKNWIISPLLEEIRCNQMHEAPADYNCETFT